MARINKTSENSTSTRYKFGVQVPKGIKNEMDSEKKNGNSLSEDVIKTKLKQLTRYQTFQFIDSGPGQLQTN
jgi:hypothetical protein